MGLTGGCLCGAVRYELSTDPMMCVACHCKNCQRQAGSILSVIIGVPKGSVETTGELKTYNDTGDSGSTVKRQFCPECGSPVFSIVAHPPGMMFVKAGTLDDTSGLNPSFHCYTKSKQAWVDVSDRPSFETVPDTL